MMGRMNNGTPVVRGLEDKKITHKNIQYFVDEIVVCVTNNNIERNGVGKWQYKRLVLQSYNWLCTKGRYKSNSRCFLAAQLLISFTKREINFRAGIFKIS